jgi:23S rRNA (cytosine1962-C5)-methyltransferase
MSEEFTQQQRAASTTPLAILYIDDDIVVIDKPIAMPTHAAQEDPYPGDVVSALGRQLGRDYLGIHQRLDSDTSGVLLFALRREANAGLADAFARRAVVKRYVAVVRGVPASSHGIVDIPLAPAPGGLRVATTAADPRGQSARTVYEVRAVCEDRSCALVSLAPETGRTHQLRAHMRALGTPIVGDPLYDPEHPFPRMLLHAAALELPHPTTHATMLFEAPIPYGFLETVERRLDLVRLALERRRVVLDDRTTSACRLLNGSADGVPGCTADMFGGRITVESDDAPQRADVEARVREIAFDRLHQSEEWSEVGGLRYAPPLQIAALIAMRETCVRVRHWSAGRRVLACGVAERGLSIAALASSADLFVVERGRRAIAWMNECIAMNAFSERPIGGVVGELHEQLERLARKERQFEMVIVDVSAAMARAPRREGWSVERIVAVAGSLAATDGAHIVLVSDDPRMTRRDVRRRVGDALTSAGIAFDWVATYGPSAIDFPTRPAEEHRAKVLVVRRRREAG